MVFLHKKRKKRKHGKNKTNVQQVEERRKNCVERVRGKFHRRKRAH